MGCWVYIHRNQVLAIPGFHCCGSHLQCNKIGKHAWIISLRSLSHEGEGKKKPKRRVEHTSLLNVSWVVEFLPVEIKSCVTWVGNIWFLNPLVLSKWEDLAFSVCMLFEESVFIFQFLNNKMHNYVLFNTFVHFIIQKLKNKHTFLKTEKAKFSRRENLVFILFEEIVFFSIF